VGKQKAGLTDIIKNSTLISGVAEKQIPIFKAKYQAIQDLKNKIAID
jgi:hypothetical protein